MSTMKGLHGNNAQWSGLVPPMRSFPTTEDMQGAWESAHGRGAPEVVLADCTIRARGGETPVMVSPSTGRIHFRGYFIAPLETVVPLPASPTMRQRIGLWIAGIPSTVRGFAP